MNGLIQKIEQTKKAMNPIELIAKFNLDIEVIFIFIGGNGRTGRLVLNLDLFQNVYPVIKAKVSDRKNIIMRLMPITAVKTPE